MTEVVGIRFKDSGKIYFFAPNGVDALLSGQQVVVETVRGPELAKVAYAPREVPEREVVGELKPVLRRAEDGDLRRLAELNSREPELLRRCEEKVGEHDLPMRLVRAEYSFDGSRLTFYFTAEKRVDFRNLVRDLARTFRTRIELRQIGPRDEAKLLGGIGPCGRTLCCATFLPDYARVSIKMAKDQDLPLNPTKISGVCGRLLCCLAYEHDQYLEIKAELPRRGAWVQTPDGPGEVTTVNVVRETVMVRLAASEMTEEYKPDVLSAATEQVAQLARERNVEGITPAVREPRPPRRPPREVNHANRRLLRSEIDDDVLDALALLEDGLEDSELTAPDGRGSVAQAATRAPEAGAPRREPPPNLPPLLPPPTEPGRREPPRQRPQPGPRRDAAGPKPPYGRGGPGQPPAKGANPAAPRREAAPPKPPAEGEPPAEPRQPNGPPRRRRRGGR